MTYFVDGYCLLANPSPKGGGYTIANKNGKIIKTCEILKVGFTNNEAELLAVVNGIKIAKTFDTVITDSQLVLGWVLRKNTGSRSDLRKIAEEANKLLKEKNIALAWLPREVNLAGIYNERHEGWLK